MDKIRSDKAQTYVVEHLDPELGPWSALEYQAIARESASAGVNFCLSSVPRELELPSELRAISNLVIEHQSVEDIFKDDKERVCLLDPAAKAELNPDDAAKFDVFLFGGILGDDPPRDRTSELRKKGFNGRRLGPVQMTTDTAVRVTRMVVQQKVPLDEILYVDYPELPIDEHESTEMPFRYVKDADGLPVMPKVMKGPSDFLESVSQDALTGRLLQGMIDLIKKDSEKGFGDLL